MRKRKAILALMLAALLLGGCGPAGAGARMANQSRAVSGVTLPDRGGLALRPFDEIEYSRPGLEELSAAVEAVGQALDRGEKLKTVTGLLDSCYDLYYRFYTMYNLADIRSCRDTTDRYYAGEYAWCQENFAQVQQLMDALYRRCAASDLAEKLEEAYFWEGFMQDYSGQEGAISDEAVALVRRESALLAQYRALIASPVIHLDGREIDYNRALQELEGEELNRVIDQYYAEYNEPLAQIYIDLVEVRQAQARVMGYDSYEQMQFDYTFERDYSPRQAQAYLEEIKECMVPLYRELLANGVYSWPDYAPLSEGRLLDLLGAAARETGGQVEEAFRFMRAYELYDIRVSPLKADLSFEAYLPLYEAPYVFLNAYGDLEDLLSFSHEFGHYVDAYVNFDAYETIDVSECFSQGLELLFLTRYGDALSEQETRQLTRMKMLDMLDTYVQQASFAAFESRVYAADPEELSAAYFNRLSLDLAEEYGYYDGISADYYAMSWVDIAHFFEMPFYVITYPVSCDCAMQLYELERQGPGAGVEKYLELLPRQHEGLIDTLSACGLESPFAPGRIEHAAEDLRALLS